MSRPLLLGLGYQAAYRACRLRHAGSPMTARLAVLLLCTDACAKIGQLTHALQQKLTGMGGTIKQPQSSGLLSVIGKSALWYYVTRLALLHEPLATLATLHHSRIAYYRTACSRLCSSLSNKGSAGDQLCFLIGCFHDTAASPSSCSSQLHHDVALAHIRDLLGIHRLYTASEVCHIWGGGTWTSADLHQPLPCLEDMFILGHDQQPWIQLACCKPAKATLAPSNPELQAFRNSLHQATRSKLALLGDAALLRFSGEHMVAAKPSLLTQQSSIGGLRSIYSKEASLAQVNKHLGISQAIWNKDTRHAGTIVEALIGAADLSRGSGTSKEVVHRIMQVVDSINRGIG